MKPSTSGASQEPVFCVVFVAEQFQRFAVHRALAQDVMDSILIAYYFQSDKQEILKRIPNAVVFDGSKQMQQDWNDRNSSV